MWPGGNREQEPRGRVPSPISMYLNYRARRVLLWFALVSIIGNRQREGGRERDGERVRERFCFQEPTWKTHHMA